MVLPALLYIAWDIFFTAKGVWSFNAQYVTGINIFNLPVEEVLFFFVVPYCCIFIYECVRVYFPSIKNKKWADIILKLLALILFVVGIIFHDRYYTSWTFIFTAVVILIIYLCRSLCKYFDAASFLIAFGIMLVPFLIVNGLLTSIPVVIYNNAENLRIRIFSIPFEDVFYGMLLIMMSIVLYERSVRREAK